MARKGVPPRLGVHLATLTVAVVVSLGLPLALWSLGVQRAPHGGLHAGLALVGLVALVGFVDLTLHSHGPRGLARGLGLLAGAAFVVAQGVAAAAVWAAAPPLHDLAMAIAWGAAGIILGAGLVWVLPAVLERAADS